LWLSYEFIPYARTRFPGFTFPQRAEIGKERGGEKMISLESSLLPLSKSLIWFLVIKMIAYHHRLQNTIFGLFVQCVTAEETKRRLGRPGCDSAIRT